MDSNPDPEEQKDNSSIENDEVDNATACKRSKHSRHRKRKFYRAICQQMEFYFGDANLSKDRFLMKLIEKDPYVPLEIFLKFNKVKKLTNSVTDIAKALTNSALLELNEDKAKVCRKTEIPKDRDADEKTIYVESLPPHADHEWVIKIFSRYGQVAYVSLPKYKNSGKIKEFGFVEFENESSVYKVLKAFKEFGGVLCTDSLDPSNLVSIVSYIKEQKELKSDNTHVSDVKDDTKIDEKNENMIISQSGTSETLKRKKENESSDEENNKFVAKKLNTDSETENNESGCETCLDTSENENRENNEEGSQAAKVKNKKTRKHRKKKNQMKITDESDFRELKILAKKDWKRLRNKYLNMQRQKFREFKQIQNREQNQSQKYSSREECNKSNNTQRTHNANFYCTNENLETDTDDQRNQEHLEKNAIKNNESEFKRNLAEEKEPLFHYEPGLIVNIKFIEPCVDLKNFKADMKQYEYVKYVDVKEGALQSYVRCDNPLNAEKFVQQINCAEYQCKILTGDLEEEYWKKIMEDREMKLNKKVKVKQKRGREKIVKALSKHIRFDDDE